MCVYSFERKINSLKNSLIYRFLKGELSSEELQQLRTEIGDDQQGFIDMLEEDWNNEEGQKLAGWSENHWNELELRLMPLEAEKQEATVFRLQWWMKVAAALFVAVSVWFVFRGNESQLPVDSDSPALITKVNDTAAPQTVILADGTKVILTAHSSLSYYENFNERYRVVHLDGEAYFETDEENKRPFIVISENITSICRGNEFSIAAYSDSDEINVVSAKGQIEIAQNDRLNSERNKVAVNSCQRYSFNKTSQQFLIGKIQDCDFDEKVQSLRNEELQNVVML